METIQEKMLKLLDTMTARDLETVSRAVLLRFIDHAAYLYETCPEVRALPEDLFLHDVFYPRIGYERITDGPAFFFEKLRGFMALPPMERALAVNAWCGGEASYCASDEVTRSPRAVYNAAEGRCGEESVFTAACLRSVGIPARQVYVPFWTHCDDNHAWVEFYADGGWHFLGACEPEPVTDLGWFNAAARRAPLARLRTRFPYKDPAADAAFIGIDPEGFYVYNVLHRYARGSELSIRVRCADGTPASGASVTLYVLNTAALLPVAHLQTDKEGRCSVFAGFSTFYVEAVKRKAEYNGDEFLTGSLLLQPEMRKDGRVIEIMLQDGDPNNDSAGSFIGSSIGSSAGSSIGSSTGSSAGSSTASSIGSSAVSDSGIVEFKTTAPIPGGLPRLPAELRTAWSSVLDSASSLLREKRAHIKSAAFPEAGLNSPSLEAFLAKLPGELRTAGEDFLKSVHPKLLQDLTEEELAEAFDASQGSRKNAVSAQDVPSELSDHDTRPAFLRLCTVSRSDLREGLTCSLSAVAPDGTRRPVPMFETYGAETRAEAPEGNLEGLNRSAEVLTELRLPEGRYELITAVRLPDGSQLAQVRRMFLRSGTEAEITIEALQIPEDRLSANYPLDRDALSAFTASSLTLLIVTEPGREPSVHIENELREEAERCRALEARGLRLLRFDASAENSAAAGLLARNMFTEPGVYPLLLLADRSTGIAAHTGYAVGIVPFMLSLAERNLK